MTKKTRLQISRPDIIRYFDALPNPILKYTDIAAILSKQRAFWRLAQRTNTQAFINFLVESANLKSLDFPFPYRSEHRYTWGDVNLLEVLLTIKPLSYFTHYTAVRMHGLTEQVPKTIYLNHEQRPHIRSLTLEQNRIDAAFSRKPRVSQNIIDYGETRICLVNGMFTNQLGVVTEELTYDQPKPEKVRLTNIERTLIDIAVRPIYSGGVAEVLKAFRLAQDRVSVNRLVATLQKLEYVYPYHQAIGFYLQRAGYKESSLDLIRQLPMKFDFYITNEMTKTDYVSEWRLYIPKGF